MPVCPLCTTEVGDDSRTIANGVAHRECLLRMATGGIGHVVDHEHWCLKEHDPDAGHSYRESALLVDAWVTANGLPGVSRR